MYLLSEWEGRTGKYLARGQDVWTARSEVRAPDREPNFLPFFFFHFHYFGGSRLRAAALLRFVCIFQEPMVLRNSFGEPVQCIATTSCF